MLTIWKYATISLVKLITSMYSNWTNKLVKKFNTLKADVLTFHLQWYWPWQQQARKPMKKKSKYIHIKLSGPILFTMYVDISLPLHGGNSPFFAKIQGSSFHYFFKKKKKTVAMSSLIFYLFMHDRSRL